MNIAIKMVWVNAAAASIVSVVLLNISYVFYAYGWPPYSKGETIIWYYDTPSLGAHRMELIGASTAFVISLVTLGLTAMPPAGLECGASPGTGPAWQLEAFHGLLATYYLLQIAFVPGMLWVTHEVKQNRATRAGRNFTVGLLWLCAAVQAAALGVLGDLAFCTDSDRLTAAFGLQCLVLAWTGLYDGVVYVRNVLKIREGVAPQRQSIL